MSETMGFANAEDLRRDTIRELNDTFRQTFIGGKVAITSGIAALHRRAPCGALLAAVQRQSEFNSDNDPHGEHDFGALGFAGQRVLWKIDYYNRDMTGGSEDPADPAQTTRVLTIMLASEY
jgi:hypothetical protein